MNYYLSKTERDQLLNMMNSSQQAFLRDELRRGKRTVFANTLAKDKGEAITPEMDLEAIECLLGEWRLLDYLDGGPRYKQMKPPYRCQCGRVLRYQYIIEHQSTKEIRKFGIVHFEEHTGFPPRVIKDIIHGFEIIDYELDEILTKYAQNWTLQLELPDGFRLSDEYIKPISLRLPLLDRQVDKLSVKIREYKLSLRSIRTPNLVAVENRLSKQRENKNKQYPKRIEIDQEFVKAIRPYLTSGTISAKEISKKLVNIMDILRLTAERQQELFVCIVIYLDGLCAKGDYVCVRKSKIDVQYRRLK